MSLFALFICSFSVEQTWNYYLLSGYWLRMRLRMNFFCRKLPIR